MALSGEGWTEVDYAFGGATVRLAHMDEEGGLEAMSAARMGLHCWDSASLLCDYMASPEHAPTFRRHASVLELGAGPGLCGLLNHALFGGAPERTVVLTDGQPAACALLAKNVGINVADEEVHVCRLRWGAADDLSGLPLPAFDAVLAADCTFSEALNPLLVATAATLLAPGRGSVFLLAVASRNSQLIIPQLVALCDDHGLTLREPRLDEHGRPLDAPRGRGDADHAGWVFRFERP